MLPSIQIYALRLPSGRSVMVRRLSTAVLLGQNRLLCPLLSRAVRVTANDDTTAPASDAFEVIRQYAAAVLVSPRMPDEISIDHIPFTDALALYHWGALGTGNAAEQGTAPLSATDFIPLVEGDGAIYLDMVCSRYGQRPSVCLGVDGAPWGLDLDLAVAYRGRALEHQGSSGDVEVEDCWGVKHRVPRASLAQSDIPNEGKVMHVEDFAGRYGAGVPVSFGGAPDGGIGPMGRPAY